MRVWNTKLLGRFAAVASLSVVAFTQGGCGEPDIHVSAATNDEECATSADCPSLGVACVFPVCDKEHHCGFVNAALDGAELPMDQNGDPVGTECQPTTEPDPQGTVYCGIMVCGDGGCSNLSVGDPLPKDPITGEVVTHQCSKDCSYATPPTVCVPYVVCTPDGCAEQCVCHD